jgi:hypothetical protein
VSFAPFLPPPRTSDVSMSLASLDTATGFPTRTNHAQDIVWEAQLLELLSGLEQRLGALTSRQNRDWPPTAVRHGLDLVATVAAEAHQFPRRRPGRRRRRRCRSARRWSTRPGRRRGNW